MSLPASMIAVAEEIGAELRTGVAISSPSHSPTGASRANGASRASVAPEAAGASRNRLLADLPERERERLLFGGGAEWLAAGTSLAEAGDVLAYVYFPTTAAISLIASVHDTPGLQVGLIGSEGVCGSPLMAGLPLAPLQARVLGAGWAWRIGAVTLREELARSAALRHMLNRYLYVLLAQTSQVAACTRYHSVEERLARWLLTTRDRVHSDSFRLKHQVMADMLGVQRSGISLAAMRLKKGGLVRYSRGLITITDPAGLQQASCDCYRWSQHCHASMLGEPGNAG